MTPVPVFLHHSVAGAPPSWMAPFTAGPAAFAEQLSQLVDSERKVIPMSRLVVAMCNRASLPPRSTVLIFDDGFADFYRTVVRGVPGRALPATSYVMTRAVRTPGAGTARSLLPPANMLMGKQIRTLDDDGAEIRGHSPTHPRLDTLPLQKLIDEIDGCRRMLVDVLGHTVSTYAYPHGYSDRRVRRCVFEAGWTSACGGANTFSSPHGDALRIGRLTVRVDTRSEVFQGWVDSRGARRDPFHERLQTVAWRLYRRSRARLGSPVGSLPSTRSHEGQGRPT